ncbi:MAG: alpha amylase N-terminal ig-like domain-containing protein [Clostridia bacterium]|nr:alpha amylase N-terminal ig-like domain-containing protein [Clostridia bacterium]
MLKKVIAIYIALAVAFSGCITVGVMLMTKYINDSQVQSAMKAENENSEILDLFHDQTDLFMEPTAPTAEDDVTLRLRTRRYNVTKAQVQFTSDKGVTWTTLDMTFEKHDDTGYYDYWVVTIPAQKDYYYYRFLVANKFEQSTRWYTLNSEVYDNTPYSEPSYSHGWRVMVGFDTPDWSKGTIWYSTLVDTFFGSNSTTDDLMEGSRQSLDWSFGRFKGVHLQGKYGGDLSGMAEKIAYLKDLGVNSIFANPVHRSYQGVGYGANTYREVENSYGTATTYKALMDKIHENGMYYMQDIDLAYTHSTNTWLGSDYFVMDGEGKKTHFYTNAMVPGWGGYCLDLGVPEAQQEIWTEKDSILQYLVNDIGVDGFRFDTGGWLWGGTETADLSANDVMTSIRSYLKKVNPEVFLLSEAGGISDTGFDSQWNRGLEEAIQGYAEGLTSAQNFYRALCGNNLMVPRNVATTLYTFTTQHDLNRVYGEEYTFKGAVALLFTFVCAPCIFYGEEISLNVELIGSAESNWMSGMNWDPSDWDYEMRNFYKAMAELRNTYSAVRTGAYKKIIVDDVNAFISYARFDKNGTVIAAVSQNEQTTQFAIDVRCAGLADGEVLTDWLTGKQYTVKDGQIIADVIPGGTAFVADGRTSTFRQEYEQFDINSKKAAIYTNDDNDFTVSGNGKLDAKSDSILFAGVDTFNDIAISSAVNGANGEVALMVRENQASDSAYYAAVAGKGKVTIKYRTANGGEAKTAATVSTNSDLLVKVTRDADNTFKTYVAMLNEDGTTSDWMLISGSEAKVNLSNKVKAGFAPISGEATLTGLTREDLEGVVGADTFDGEQYSALLNGLTNNENATLADGYLTLKPIAEEVTFITTNRPDYDWTFKTALKYAPTQEGDRAGVVVKGSDAEWVSVGRTVVDGKSAIYFGKAHGGQFHIMYTAEDAKPNDEVIVQLQKIGMVYTAVYSYDGVTWYTVGDEWLYMNFAEWKIGLYLEGTVDASFNYASFGDSVNDGKSVNTPHTPGTIDMSVDQNTAYAKQNMWTNYGGKWEESTQGVRQTDSTVLGIMADDLVRYGDFRTHAGLNFVSGEGWAGIGFGKSAVDAGVTDGFLLKYTTDKKLAVYKGTEKLAETDVNVADGESLFVVLEAHRNGEIIVYTGQSSVITIHLKDTGYTGFGYLCYYTEGVVADIENYTAHQLVGNWTDLAGSFVGAGNSLTVLEGSMTNLTGVGVTNYITTVKLGVNPVTTATAAARVTLSAPQGVSGAYKGLLLQFDQYGKLSIWENGLEVDSYETGHTAKNGRVNCFVMITKQNGTYKFYVDGGNEPVITYTEDYVRGGTITFEAYASACKFTNLNINNITSTESIEDHEIFKAWLAGTISSTAKLPTFKSDYDTNAALGDLNIISGEWVLKDGALQCTAATAWNNRVAVNNTPYDNFKISFDLKATGGGSWFGVSLRSPEQGQDHANGGGIMIYVSGGNGTIGFVYGKDQGDNSPLQIKKYVDKIPGYRYGEFSRLTITCIGADIKVHAGDTLLAELTDPCFYEGYIRFTAGMSVCAFDNLVIEPIFVK